MRTQVAQSEHRRRPNQGCKRGGGRVDENAACRGARCDRRAKVTATATKERGKETNVAEGNQELGEQPQDELDRALHNTRRVMPLEGLTNYDSAARRLPRPSGHNPHDQSRRAASTTCGKAVEDEGRTAIDGHATEKGDIS